MSEETAKRIAEALETQNIALAKIADNLAAIKAIQRGQALAQYEDRGIEL